MLQILLLLGLTLEGIVYLLLALYWRRQGMDGILITLFLLMLAVGLRIAAALPTYLLSSLFRLRDRNPQPWLPSLGALAREIDARAFALSIVEPFHQLLLPKEPLGPTVGTPILLVHGYVSNRGLMWAVRKRLAAASLGPVYTVNLRPMFGSIDEMVPGLAARIDTICLETGASSVNIVAHSMGGLVVRAYLVAHAESARVARLITLCSPHQGTQMAVLGLGRCVREMRPGSERLKALLAAESATPKPPTLSVYTLNDDLVYPAESSRLAWAENLPMSGVGHVSLMSSKPVAERVIAALKM